MTLEEALGITTQANTDESIHVDVNTRQVTVPESQQIFGVESDANVEIKHIVIDGRYADGTDLSKLTIRINYQNANGDKATYLVSNVKANADSVEFDWVLARSVTAYKGEIAFIVCAYSTKGSVITPEWNSTLGHGTVLEGLETTAEDIGGEDLIENLRLILDEVSTNAKNAKASADSAKTYSDQAKDYITAVEFAIGYDSSGMLTLFKINR